MGVVLALLYRSVPAKSRLWNSGARFYLPGIGIILLVLANGDRIPYPVTHNGLLAPAYATIIFGLALGGGILVRFLSMPAMVFLGNASYAMYILHEPIGTWMNIGFRRVLHIDPQGTFWLICYVTAVIGLASVFFWKAEEPAHRWLRKRLNNWAEGRRQAVPVAHN
jgi:peptidoglycan/LPS O-acetylase OafA/YrhL